MTEHTRIPPQPGRQAQAAGRSLIERAVTAFDLSRLAPPPISGEPAARLARVIEPSEPLPSPVSGPVSVPVPVPVPVPLPVAPPVPTAAPAPAEFRGPHCRVEREHLREQGLIVPEGAVTALLEEFRIIKRQLLAQVAELRQRGAGPVGQRVLVCSPHPGEGKTYCAVNLALATAREQDSEVVLVDADFAKPSVLSVLGIPGSKGLMDALIDPQVDVLDCVIATDVPGLWVLPAGHATNADSEYLNARQTRAVLDRLTEGAPNRLVIFDSPPALAASPAAVLAKYVGQALVVARADRTGQGALEDAISLLAACPNIQLLLNAVNFSPSGRRFGSYYGYGG